MKGAYIGCAGVMRGTVLGVEFTTGTASESKNGGLLRMAADLEGADASGIGERELVFR